MLRIATGLLFGSMIVLLFTELPHLILSLSILLIAVYFLIYFNIKKRNYLVIGLATVAGYAMTASVVSYQQAQAFEPLHEGKDLIISGNVDSMVRVNDISQSFLFNVASASLVSQATPIEFTGLIRLSVYNKSMPIKAGQRWQLQVRLKRGSGFKNPDGFDYEKWLFSKRIHAKGYIRKSDQHRLLADAPWYSVDSLREKIKAQILTSIASDQNDALVSALILAEKSGLSKEQWDVFRSTGTSHLMAISGLHIGLVASSGLLFVWLLWWLLPNLNLLVPQKVAGSFLGAMLAIAYALLAGMTIPTQRALIMVLLGLYLLAGRQYFSSYRILALSLVVVLLIDPLAIMSVGFYLSFSAVFIIIWLLNRVMKQGRFGLLKLQGFLSLLMVPMSLLFFGEGSLISPIANLIAIPWVSFIVVPLSMLSVLVSFINEGMASYLFQFLSLHLDALYNVLVFLAQIPGATFESLHLPSLLLAALVVAGVILLLPVGFTWRYTAITCLLPLLFYQVEKPTKENSFWLTILDVGQGLAVVIETKNHSLLYDAGNRASDSFDTGELVVVPYLKHQTIHNLDAVVISHDDRDHMGGLEAVLKSHSVQSFYGNRLALTPTKENELCESGIEWVWDGVKFEFIHPMLKFKGNDNDRSCVLKVSVGEHAALLTGDIQRKAENHLLRAHKNSPEKDLLSADVLLMPHHGSNTSSSVRFIKAVNPRWAIASAAYRSRFRHPAEKVVNRYQKMGVKVLATAPSGAIQFRIDKDRSIESPINHRRISRGFWSRQE